MRTVMRSLLLLVLCWSSIVAAASPAKNDLPEAIAQSLSEWLPNRLEAASIQFGRPDQRTGYALGLFREVTSNTFSLYHEGGGRGFASHMMIYPELGFGAVLLTNRDHNGLTGVAGRQIMNGPIVKRFGPRPVADHGFADKRPLDVADPRLQSIAGRYGDSEVSITVKNGYLYYRDGKCAEREPGMFFRYDGEVLDLRSTPPHFANMELRRREHEVVASGLAGEGDMTKNLVHVAGGTFRMGDVFGDGDDDERPVHQVTLSDYYISATEVTVAQFRSFVEDTGYRTSAEGPDDQEARDRIMERLSAGGLSEQEMLELRLRFLRYAGAGYWDALERKWRGYNPATNWRNPGIDQTERDPVLAISPVDAMHYCNWLSSKAGLPAAYDPETGDILGAGGDPTLDVSGVLGYRLPTEAEWEYAARERGRKVRFGNGRNTARSTEINFRGDAGDYDYLESGDYAGRTTPVGSYPPNRLGLYDMSGNAWEWASDHYASYNRGPQVNPYIRAAGMHAARGGRWGGDAFEIRVFHRDAYPMNDRCNNTGFRIARSTVTIPKAPRR